MEFRIMKKTFNCTKENPLRCQIVEEEKSLMDEIAIEGFLSDTDLMVLREMSNQYVLRVIDMTCVNELSAEIDYYLENDELSFDKLEELYLPEHVEAFPFTMFMSCNRLKKVEIPESLKELSEYFLAFCPNIDELYVPCKLRPYQWFNSQDTFLVGSAKRFVSDRDTWSMMEDDDDDLYASDGVLYRQRMLYRYPAGDMRSHFVVPEGTDSIGQLAICNNEHLRTVTIPSSCVDFWSGAICNCQSLETLIFKNEHFFFNSDCNHPFDFNDDPGPHGLRQLPNLKDVYLYAKDPDEVSQLFDGLYNMDNVVLHVPCFCANNFKKHMITTVDYEKGALSFRQGSYGNRFLGIEEFDPIDFIEDDDVNKLD